MSRRKRILLFASTTGYQTRVFAQTARKMGLDLVLATDRCRSLDDPWGDQAVPVKFDLPSEAGRLEARFSAVAFDGVAAVGDGPALLAALVAERFGLPFHTGEGAAACRDKFIMRERFRAAGLPVPKYRRLPLDQDPQPAVSSVSYPCVLKPLGLSASRGVIRANDARAFGAAFHRTESILGAAELRRLKGDARNFLQVEDYIEGREFALEGLVTGGELQVLALFDKPDPLDGPYFEETIYVTPSREPDSVQQRIVEATRQSVETLGLRHGPVHAEMRVKESEERYRSLVELAPDAIVVHRDGLILFANSAGVKLFAAADSAELIGRPLDEFFLPARGQGGTPKLRPSQDSIWDGRPILCSCGDRESIG